jgi:hypothetical protein
MRYQPGDKVHVEFDGTVADYPSGNMLSGIHYKESPRGASGYLTVLDSNGTEHLLWVRDRSEHVVVVPVLSAPRPGEIWRDNADGVEWFIISEKDEDGRYSMCSADYGKLSIRRLYFAPATRVYAPEANHG